MDLNIHLKLFWNHDGSLRHWFHIDKHGIAICAFGSGFTIYFELE